jgi:PAS domain S-box-containing protein
MDNKEKFLTHRIIEDMSEGVIVISFDGEIVLLNRAAEKILG